MKNHISDPFRQIISKQNSLPIAFRIITLDDLRELHLVQTSIKFLKNRKTPSLSNISNFVLKHFPEKDIKHICKTINKSMQYLILQVNGKSQLSILGSCRVFILFKLYINNIPLPTSNLLKLLLYADDIAFYCRHKNQSATQNYIQVYLFCCTYISDLHQVF